MIETKYSDDDECETDFNELVNIYNYYVPSKLNKSNKQAEMNLNIVTEVREPIAKNNLDNNILYALPCHYRTKYSEKSFLPWIFANKFELA